MRTLKALSPILLVAALLAGCGGGGSARLSSGDVAVVGDQHISKAQFDDLMQEAKASYTEQGRSFPKQGSTDYESVKAQAVSLLVQQAARESKASSLGVKITDKDVSTRLASIKKQYFGGSESKYKAQLKKQHLTDAQLRSDIRSQLISEALFNKVTKDVKVSDSEVHSYYTAHKSLYQQPASRDVRYILVGKSKATAQSVYDQLKTGGDKAWCTLAKKYAKDSSGQNCGKATFTKGQTVAVFDKAAFDTPTKTIHKPFYDPTQYKAWFVMEPLGAAKKATTTPEKQVAASIRQTLLQQDKNQKMADWVASTMKSFCGGKIKYGVGYSASPDPCAATTTSAVTTTG
ncbi:MAG TPA: SurA N-terminal domain-containing protein [Gaiellaceae bacterium]|nr:SurA N-terminal domain-containing protein [Gaiellaceae bacterium]